MHYLRSMQTNGSEVLYLQWFFLVIPKLGLKLTHPAYFTKINSEITIKIQIPCPWCWIQRPYCALFGVTCIHTRTCWLHPCEQSLFLAWDAELLSHFWGCFEILDSIACIFFFELRLQFVSILHSSWLSTNGLLGAMHALSSFICMIPHHFLRRAKLFNIAPSLSFSHWRLSRVNVFNIFLQDPYFLH